MQCTYNNCWCWNSYKCVCGILATVSELDNTPPAVNGCPPSSTNTVPLGSSTTSVTWTEPTATDDSGVEPTVVSTHTSGQDFPVGTTQVSYIFTDAVGNEAICSFSVIGNINLPS